MMIDHNDSLAFFHKFFGAADGRDSMIHHHIEYLLPVVIAAPCMGMRSTTGESIYNRWNRRMYNIHHVARGGAEKAEHR